VGTPALVPPPLLAIAPPAVESAPDAVPPPLDTAPPALAAAAGVTDVVVPAARLPRSAAITLETGTRDPHAASSEITPSMSTARRPPPTVINLRFIEFLRR
jgi:hypothetical protein